MKSYLVRITEPALYDLASIRRHIASENPLAATRLSVQLLSSIDRLDYLPERGRLGVLPGTRELVTIWPYVIVYRIMDDTVQVLHIHHGAQHR